MSNGSFYFYDLETSGLTPKHDRIMQFGGMRTDADFKPIGEPFSCYVRLTEEVLPSPQAILVTGITPQKTKDEGYSEAEFLRLAMREICQPGTTIMGFNNVSFDDEFMRYTLYRNFYDPYEWQWAEDRSRWDLMNVVRMVRALRPDGIKWPADKDGKERNRLELITAANGISHEDAHDAPADVRVTLAVARLLRDKQPKMFDYLFKMRTKKAALELLDPVRPKPLLFATYLGTIPVLPLANDPASPNTVLAYDLRINPDDLMGLDDAAFEQMVFHSEREPRRSATLTRIKATACPVLAPIGVLDEAAEERLGITAKEVEATARKVVASEGLKGRILSLIKKPTYPEEADVEHQLYDGFIDDRDKPVVREVREASADKLTEMHPKFSDERLQALFPRYMARNFPKSLSGDDRDAWESYRSERVLADLPVFSRVLAQQSARTDLDDQQQFLLQELQLWAESIMPLAD